ncbi:hypothetical protein XENTR_v10015349 [Xenopus tropicalis]|uniref:Glutamine rich 1 like 2 Kruppel-associated box containing [provisional] n=1 Tax=Xenopus tropicalis TaxID=8364 RepID=A0A6I8Q979_XENTR|nr:uncharacterized protein qrich1l2 isoform X1 [Xenopus tropicalis]KAE8605854.1 hypothetical protein XENTR_v10015349 [Xenopus tropicalis]
MDAPCKLDNKNTLKKTKFDLRIIQSYLLKAGEARELLKIPVEPLDDHLANFISTHRKQDGSEYEPGTLRGILGSLDRHFEKSNYPYAIYRSRDTKFRKTVKAMKEKQSYLKKMGKGNHPHHTEPLTEREIELLYTSGTIGMHSPAALLHMLFFNIGLHFSLRAMEQHSLMWGEIVLKADSQGRKYLEYTKKLFSGRNSGKLHPSETMKMQIYESPEQPDRDVVRAYEKYALERPEKMKRKEAPFYLTPQSDCRPGYACWYKSLPMGENRIRSIMKNLKAAAKLPPQKRVMSHISLKSLRAKSLDLAGPRLKDVKNEPANSPVNGGPPGNTGDSSDPESEHKQRKGSSRGSRVPIARAFSSPGSPRCTLSSHKAKRGKDDWELNLENSLNLEADSEENSLFPQQVSVTFHDVAACFSAKEWARLEDWQKELYRNVIREIHATLEAMGCTIANSDVLLKIKEDDAGGSRKDSDKTDTGTAPSGTFSPDILLRIKQDELPDWRDVDVAVKEEELDTSNSSIPVFDPDLSMWIFKEAPELCPSENASDQVLPSDADEEGHIPLAIPEPEISAPFPFPEAPRPGKRKRRPPQRRSSEQRPDTDDEEPLDFLGEPQPPLPYSNPSPEDSTDWMPHERLYQCDLCERGFSDRCFLPGRAPLSCPQCGGTLNPLYSQSQCTNAHLAQTLQLCAPPGGTGLSHPMQGPVG